MRRNLFWLSDEQWERIEPHLPTDVRGVERRTIDASSAASCMFSRAAVAGAIARPSMVHIRRSITASCAGRGVGIWENLFRELAGNGRSTDTQMINSTHVKAHRSAAGGKGGRQKQAVGRSRGGRNTKIHALADAKGRLIAILLTGGEAHDCPVAERLIRRVTPPKHMLGDKAYDSAELRERTRRARNQAGHSQPQQQEAAVQLQQAPLQAALAYRERVQQVEGLQAHRHPIRQAGAKLPGLCLPCRSPCMVDLMSLDPSERKHGVSVSPCLFHASLNVAFLVTRNMRLFCVATIRLSTMRASMT